MTPRVREILSWYGADNVGTLTNLARLLNHGRLAGTGKLVILPVDQGFEHGPARSFAPNPPAYNPHYHFELAIEAGCNAYAAPLGFLEAGARDFAGEIPLILKTNDTDVLRDEKDPNQALTASVQDALRLGCCAVGFTIYPGSAHQLEMYGQLRGYAEEAKRNGLAVVVWAYPRGSGLSKDGESAIDVAGYAVQIAAQLGAHIIKVKLPTAHIEQNAAGKVYDEQRIPITTPAARVRHVVDCAFAGRRIVIFSGGAAVFDDDKLLDEIRASIPAAGSVRSSAATHSSGRRKRRSGCLARSWLFMRRRQTGIECVEPRVNHARCRAAKVDHRRAVDLVGGFRASRRGGSRRRCRSSGRGSCRRNGRSLGAEYRDRAGGCRSGRERDRCRQCDIWEARS